MIDIGGGSTELVTGGRGGVAFHVSTQVGVVRHSERHLHSDPPAAEELEALGEDAGRALARAVPELGHERVSAAVAVAGTATQCAGIDLGFTPADVEGHRLSLATLEAMLDAARGAPARGAPRGPRPRSPSRPDDRRRRDRPDPYAGRVRPQRGGGLRSRHPVGRSDRAGVCRLGQPPTPHVGGFWTFVRLFRLDKPAENRPVGMGGRASRRRPLTHRPGRSRIHGASRRSGHQKGPEKARTPARPDGAKREAARPPRAASRLTEPQARFEERG